MLLSDHWQDVLVGAIVGTLFALFSYRMYYPPLTSTFSHRPYSRHLPVDATLIEGENGIGGHVINGDLEEAQYRDDPTYVYALQQVDEPAQKVTIEGLHNARKDQGSYHSDSGPSTSLITF